MEKRKSNAFRKDIYLLGADSEGCLNCIEPNKKLRLDRDAFLAKLERFLESIHVINQKEDDKMDKNKLIAEWRGCESEDQWVFFCEDLTRELKRLGMLNCTLFATVLNFGWQSLNGELVLNGIETSQMLLQKLLPRTECYFKVYEEHDGSLAINITHHDSPAWAEWYHVRIADYCPECETAFVDDSEQKGSIDEYGMCTKCEKEYWR